MLTVAGMPLDKKLRAQADDFLLARNVESFDSPPIYEQVLFLSLHIFFAVFSIFFPTIGHFPVESVNIFGHGNPC